MSNSANEYCQGGTSDANTIILGIVESHLLQGTSPPPRGFASTGLWHLICNYAGTPLYHWVGVTTSGWRQLETLLSFALCVYMCVCMHVHIFVNIVLYQY